MRGGRFFCFIHYLSSCWHQRSQQASCADPSHPAKTYVNLRSKLTAASTFWVGWFFLPLKATTIFAGTLAWTWVPSIAPMKSYNESLIDITCWSCMKLTTTQHPSSLFTLRYGCHLELFLILSGVSFDGGLIISPLSSPTAYNCWRKMCTRRQTHSKPNKAGFTRAKSHETCQSIFPEN
jgi:hypothetical protein